MLHTFTNGADGRDPAAGLTMNRSGNLYGTAAYGGRTNCDQENGCGTVFKLTKVQGGWVFSTLYQFNYSDGMAPAARVIFGPDGSLYGTTEFGGNSNPTCENLFSGCGVVFKLSPPPTTCRSTSCPWNEKVLYNFTGDDGAFPENEVAFDSTGSLYGTTQFGGTANIYPRLWGVRLRQCVQADALRRLMDGERPL